MVNQEFVKSIVSEVRKGLFEGGAGSGNWGHKGRPGHRGGSLGGGKGGKTTGKGWGELPKARAMTSNEKKFWEKFRKERVGGSGISAHKVGGADKLRGIKKGDVVRITEPSGLKFSYPVDKLSQSKYTKGGIVMTAKEGTLSNLAGMPITYTRIIKPEDKVEIFRGGKKVSTSVGVPVVKKYWPAGKGPGEGKAGGISPHMVKAGVHASTFYDKSGGLKTSEYKKLTDNQKVAVLKHGIQKYKENYVPKAKQAGMSSFALKTNRQVGALEGMRRAAITKAKGLSGKENRAAMHVAISLQQRAKDLAGVVKASGRRWVATMQGRPSEAVVFGIK